jgi:predicted transcriptional regulator
VKGLVRRTAADRGFAYEAAIDEAAFAVRRIQDVLDAAHDRDGALMSFVGGLSRRDRKALLRMLAEDEA